jgi:hypothetical protein
MKRKIKREGSEKRKKQLERENKTRKGREQQREVIERICGQREGDKTEKMKDSQPEMRYNRKKKAVCESLCEPDRHVCEPPTVLMMALRIIVLLFNGHCMYGL